MYFLDSEECKIESDSGQKAQVSRRWDVPPPADQAAANFGPICHFWSWRPAPLHQITACSFLPISAISLFLTNLIIELHLRFDQQYKTWLYNFSFTFIQEPKERFVEANFPCQRSGSTIKPIFSSKRFKIANSRASFQIPFLPCFSANIDNRQSRNFSLNISVIIYSCFSNHRIRLIETWRIRKFNVQKIA